MSEDHGNCDGCGTPLKLAPGIDTYCPNKACSHEWDQAKEMAARWRETRERAEYERLKAKFG